MEIGSLAAALEREHHEIDAGIAAFTAAPGDRQPLIRATGALRRHICLEEEFLFPLLHKAEPGLASPMFVMLREHAQIWGTLDSLERMADAGTGTGLALCKRLTVQLLHHAPPRHRDPPAAARRPNQLAWPASAILIPTGSWNAVADRPQHPARLSPAPSYI